MKGKAESKQPLGDPMIDAIRNIKDMLSKAAGKKLEEKKAQVLMIKIKDPDKDEDECEEGMEMSSKGMK